MKPGSVTIRYKQVGTGLVEIMVAIAVGLFLMAGIGQIFVNSKQTYRLTEAVSRLQENGRFIMIKMAEDIRLAGFRGCGSGGLKVTNGLKPDNETGMIPAGYRFNQSVAGKRKNSNDSITIQYALDRGVRLNESMTSRASTLGVGSNRVLKKSSVVLLCDAISGDIFQITDVTSSGRERSKSYKAKHAAGSDDPLPGNGRSADCTGAEDAHCTSKAYAKNAKVMLMMGVSYFIQGDRLMREQNNIVSTLIDGVESMSLTYGVDTDEDRNVDEYRAASNVGDWENVMSVRVSLDLKSPESNLTSTADKSLRRSFDTTINLRNRTL